MTPEEARVADVDVVILQRPDELHRLAGEWLGERALPTVYSSTRSRRTAREAALGINRFLADWDDVLEEVAA